MHKIKTLVNDYAVIRALTTGYISFSVIRIILFFAFGYGGNLLYALWGNFSVFLPFLGLIIAGEVDSTALTAFMVFYWALNLFFLVVSYFDLLKKKRCFLLKFVVYFDVLFSVAFTGMNILYGGFMVLHLATFVGVLCNLAFGLSICWYKA